MKKRHFYIILCALSTLSCLAGCNNTGGENSNDQPLRVEIPDECPKLVQCGNTIELQADVINDLDDSGVTWTANDGLVAVVTSDGKLTGISQGTVKAKAQSVADPTKSAEVTISVNYNTLISVEITTKLTSIKVGETIKLKAVVNGDSTDSGVGWMVNNEALATIDQDGNLMAIQKGVEGKIIVNAFSKINPSATSANLEIEIRPNNDGEEAIEDLVEKVGDYRLIFKDDFSANNLNKNNWEVMTGDGRKYGVTDWGNDEKQFYREDNIKFKDSEMYITAKKEENRNDTRGKIYTSGRVRSEGLVSYVYGRIEARISCPFGDGLWPAFWMLPDTKGNPYGGWPNSGEIDIMEVRGRQHYSMFGTIHIATETGTHTTMASDYLFPDGEDISNYHIYAVEWEEGSLKWYCDGELFLSIDENDPWTITDGTGTFPAPFDQKFHILLNMAVGGNFDGNRLPLNSDLPAYMKIDYVKWYQK